MSQILSFHKSWDTSYYGLFSYDEPKLTPRLFLCGFPKFWSLDTSLVKKSVDPLSGMTLLLQDPTYPENYEPPSWLISTWTLLTGEYPFTAIAFFSVSSINKNYRWLLVIKGRNKEWLLWVCFNKHNNKNSSKYI